MHYEFMKVYAIRESAKGWSDIIYTADTKEAAESLVKKCHEVALQEGAKRNYRIEEIYNLATVL